MERSATRGTPAITADFLNEAAAEVFRLYPRPLWSGSLSPLGNRGGFSGARLWRLDSPAGPLCLRAWPEGFSPTRLDFIHRCMGRARSAELGFAPRLFASLAGNTHVEYAGRLWELQEWLPGEADFHRRPSPTKLRAACAALARLHLCWQEICPGEPGPCSAVQRRLAVVSEWGELLQSGWRPPARADDPVSPAVARAWRLLPRWIDAVPDLLRRWMDRTWPIQPCLCDVWHDHILFDGDRVTGIVDYGAMKIDHPAVDVARLLGSLVEDDAEGWATGMAAYRTVRPFSADEDELARTLDVSGTIAGAALWLRWLYYDGKVFEDRAAAARRLEALATRMERFPAKG